jgi:hypothetical protein
MELKGETRRVALPGPKLANVIRKAACFGMASGHERGGVRWDGDKQKQNGRQGEPHRPALLRVRI